MNLQVTQELFDRLKAVDIGEDDALYCFLETVEDGFTRGYLARELEYLYNSMGDKDAKDQLISMFSGLL